MINPMTHIVIGDFEVWTYPWRKNKAAIVANEGGIIRLLYNLHKREPSLFETLVDDVTPEDIENTFTVIVDPDKVSIDIQPGYGRIGISCKEGR